MGWNEDLIARMRSLATPPANNNTVGEIVVSLFDNVRVVTPFTRNAYWAEILEELRTPEVLDVPADATPKALKAAKRTLKAWCFASFVGERAKENVQYISLLVFDYDNADSAGRPLPQAQRLSPAQGAQAWQHCAGAVATTFSHSNEHPKFRLLLRLSRQITPAEHRRLWRWGAAHGAERGLHVDRTCKDPCRLFFQPARTSSGPYEVYELAGAPIDVDAVLATLPAEAAEPTEHEMPPAEADPAVVRRAISYIARMPAAIAGQGGHAATFNVARTLGRGFALHADAVHNILRDHYNPRCEPPWSEEELQHKANEGAHADAKLGYLLDSPEPERPGKARSPSEVIRRWASEGPLQRFATGIAALDNLCRGGIPAPWRFVIVGAPSAGKTFLLAFIAWAFAMRGMAVGLLCVDEDAEDERSGWRSSPGTRWKTPRPVIQTCFPAWPLHSPRFPSACTARSTP